MNREIKFRAWDVLYKKYHHNVELTHPYGEEKRETLFVCFQEYLLSTTTFIVEQYTGLKDKNGKEIYEGDIVKLYDKYVGKIVFLFGGFIYQGPSDGLTFLGALHKASLKVIGNIHENEELLEREEQ